MLFIQYFTALIPRTKGLAGLAALAHLNQGLRLSKGPRVRNGNEGVMRPYGG